MIKSSLSAARVRKRGEVSETINEKPECSKKVIPLPTNHIHRTASELQLAEDTRTAELRDLCMYHRLVGGMQQRSHNHNYLFEMHAHQQRSRFRGDNNDVVAFSHELQTAECLANIYSTRHQKAEQLLGSSTSGEKDAVSDWSIEGYWDKNRSKSAPPAIAPEFPVLDDPMALGRAVTVESDNEESPDVEVFSIEL